MDSSGAEEDKETSPEGNAEEEGEEGGNDGQEQEDGEQKEGVVAADSTSAPASASPAADDSDVVMVSPRGGRAVSDSGSDYEGGSAAAGGGGVARRPNLGALMTMLVVSLRMQRLVHWVVRKRCLDGLSAENLVDLLAALEVRRESCEVRAGVGGVGLRCSVGQGSDLAYGQTCDTGGVYLCECVTSRKKSAALAKALSARQLFTTISL